MHCTCCAILVHRPQIRIITSSCTMHHRSLSSLLLVRCRILPVHPRNQQQQHTSHRFIRMYTPVIYIHVLVALEPSSWWLSVGRVVRPRRHAVSMSKIAHPPSNLNPCPSGVTFVSFVVLLRRLLFTLCYFLCLPGLGGMLPGSTRLVGWLCTDSSQQKYIKFMCLLRTSPRSGSSSNSNFL